MPGPMSDSYDPEFGTAAEAQRVADAIQQVIDRLDIILGPKVYIFDVISGKPGLTIPVTFSQRELRIIRFALNRATDSI